MHNLLTLSQPSNETWWENHSETSLGVWPSHGALQSYGGKWCGTRKDALGVKDYGILQYVFYFGLMQMCDRFMNMHLHNHMQHTAPILPGKVAAHGSCGFNIYGMR